MARWAACGGWNEPPSNPMRMPAACSGRRGNGSFIAAGSRPHLSVAADAIIERAQLFRADRTARMHAAGGDADLGAEAELTAIGELRRRVMQHDRGIHFA